MKTIGNVAKKCPLIVGQSANGNFWSKQTVVVSEGDRHLAIEFFGDRRTNKIKTLKEGDLVEVVWEPSSDVYNEKWYTKLVGLSIVALKPVDTNEDAPPQGEVQQSMPPADEPPF